MPGIARDITRQLLNPSNSSPIYSVDALDGFHSCNPFKNTPIQGQFNDNTSSHTPPPPHQLLLLIIYILLGYNTSSSLLYSSFNVLGAVNLINNPTLPALSHVPLDLDPPNDCCPMTAAVILQLI